MKLKGLTITILVASIGFVQLAAARPGLSQTEPTDLNTELRQALCAENWEQALQILNRMKRAAGPEYASQIIMYQGRIESLARKNVNLSALIDGCSDASVPSGSAPANNAIPPAPNSTIPSLPSL